MLRRECSGTDVQQKGVEARTCGPTGSGFSDGGFSDID
jgi:hypothetical protein